MKPKIKKFPKSLKNSSIDKIIDKIPAGDIINVVREIASYKKVVEREDTKRELIMKKYKNQENKINSVIEILSKQIEEKSKENKIKIERTFDIVEKLLENGVTDSIDKILISLNQSEYSYIDEETTKIMQSILDSDENEFITIEPIEERQ